MKAGFLLIPTEVAKHLDTPFAEWLDSGREFEPRPSRGQGTVTAHPLVALIGRLQTQEAARQLALEALRLRRTRLASGEYPIDDQAAPAGSSYERSAEIDGSIVLALPRVEEYYRSATAQPNSLFGDLFRWRLPA